MPKTIYPPGGPGSGPWKDLAYFVACNSSEACDALIPGVHSRAAATCSSSALISPEDTLSSKGGCVCSIEYASDGPICGDATTGTGTSAMIVAALAFAAAMALLYLPNLVYIIKKKKLNAFNAANITLVLMWLALLGTIATLSLLLVRVLRPDLELELGLVVIWRLSMIFLASGILNMSAAFVELGSTKKAVSNVRSYYKVLVGTVLVLVISVAIIIALASKELVTVIGIAVACVIAIISLAGPLYLYVKAVRNLERLRIANKENLTGASLQVGQSSLCALLGAMFFSIFWDSRYVYRILGLSSDSSGSRELGGSRDAGSRGLLSSREDASDGAHAASSPVHSPAVTAMKSQAPSPTTVAEARKSNAAYTRQPDSSADAAHRRDATMIEFLAKTSRMGTLLCFNLVIYFCFSAANVRSSTIYDPNRSLNLATLYLAISWVFFVLSIVSVLWYLGDAKGTGGPFTAWLNILRGRGCVGGKERSSKTIAQHTESKDAPQLVSKSSKLSVRAGYFVPSKVASGGSLHPGEEIQA